MNRKTNINLSWFIFLDMSNIACGQGCHECLTTGVLSMRFRTNLKKETIIAMDEAGNIIRNPSCRIPAQADHPGDRSYRGLVHTQQPTDLVQANVSDQMKTNIPST
jgi:hypothetical protein